MSMLSDEERRRIETEELAAAGAAQAGVDRARRRLAALSYRREVRAALRPRPFWWPVRWALLLGPVALGVLWAAQFQAQPALADDAAGGVRNADLTSRCQAEVERQLLAAPGTLRFPPLREAGEQMTANADGKRWDGWAEASGRVRTDFSCTYTAADGSVLAELLGEESP